MEDKTLTPFMDMVRVFLSRNPLMIDALIEVIHSTAEELDTWKQVDSISYGKYISPSQFKNIAMDTVLSKIGHPNDSISNICRQGRGYELLHVINQLQLSKTESSISPSRRILPPPNRMIIEELPDE